MAAELEQKINNLQVQQTAISKEPSEQIRPQSRVVDLIDRKDGEIKHLKLLNATDKETIARMQLSASTQARVEASVELERFRSYIKTKYELDFSTHEINNSTGEIVPRTLAASGMGKQLLELLSSPRKM